jgi:hypothetical protein
MADVIKRVTYYYTEVQNRPGAGARVMDALRASKVNLVAYTGFPSSTRRAQLDFVPANQRAFVAAARKANIKLVGPKTAFLIQGSDRVGAVAEVLDKLAAAGINVVAMDAVAAGRRRYGAILWVKPRDVQRAAQVLGAS